MAKTKEGAWLDSIMGKNQDLEKRLGVKPVSLSAPDGGTWEKDTQHRQGYNDEMVHAARNDYDFRRTMEAAALSGKKESRDSQ